VEGNAPNAERRAELIYVLIGLNPHFGAFPCIGKANSIEFFLFGLVCLDNCCIYILTVI